MANIVLTNEEKEQMKSLLVEASAQLDKIGKVIPEGKNALKKYPGINPVGHYSEIDMEFTDRMKRCENAVRTKNFLTWLEYNDVKGRIEKQPAFAEMKSGMEEVSKRLRVTERALRLCKDDKIRAALEEQKEELKNNPVVKDYDTLLKILESFSGVHLHYAELNKIPKTHENNDLRVRMADEITEYQHSLEKFCYEKFGVLIGVNKEYNPYHQVERFSNPKSLEIEFEDLDDIMMCQRMASDENLGKSWDEVKNAPLSADAGGEYLSSIPEYMQASCDRVLDSVLPDVMDRADYILINGVSVREQMRTQEGIENPTEEDVKKYSSLYVAGALRQGIYVETFVKDYTPNGTFVNYKPVPIVAKGQDTTFMKKESENEIEKITIGFIDRLLATLGITYFVEKMEKAERFQKEAEDRQQKRNAVMQPIKAGRRAFRDAHTPKTREEEKAMAGQVMKARLTEEQVKIKKDAFELLQKEKHLFLEQREQVNKYDSIRPLLVSQFFPKGAKTVTNEASGRQVQDVRETFLTFAVVKMLRENFTLEQVLDLSQGADTKAKMAELVCDELRTCDEKRFFEMHMEVTDILGEHLERYAKDHNISFANPSSVFQNPILMELCIGAGNVPDIFVQKENKEILQKYFGEDIIDKVDTKSGEMIINSAALDKPTKKAGRFQRLADGDYGIAAGIELALRNEVMYKVYAKYEQATGKVFSHPINLIQLEGLQNMVLCHPKLEEFIEKTPENKLAQLMMEEKLLDTMGIDFKLLPTKQLPNKSLESERFAISLDRGEVQPLDIVPTFKGSSSFYKMKDADKVMEEIEKVAEASL